MLLSPLALAVFSMAVLALKSPLALVFTPLAMLPAEIAAGVGLAASGDIVAACAAGVCVAAGFAADAAGIGWDTGSDAVGARDAAVANGDAVIATDRRPGADRHGIGAVHCVSGAHDRRAGGIHRRGDGVVRTHHLDIVAPAGRVPTVDRVIVAEGTTLKTAPPLAVGAPEGQRMHIKGLENLKRSS